MLSRRQKYDYRDIDRMELKLIRVGHACWALYKAQRRLLGEGHTTTKAYLEACESVWEAKRKYRLKLKQKRAEAWAARKGVFVHAE